MLVVTVDLLVGVPKSDLQTVVDSHICMPPVAMINTAIRLETCRRLVTVSWTK